MNLIKASNYSIIFEQNNYDNLTAFLEKIDYSSIFILVDNHTEKFCLPHFLSKINFEYEVITIPFGENHKNLETCSTVWNKLTKLNADRKSILINIGGGMVTDIGGFIASTFKRGMDFINISTSLLGMVDASVGGKTGIDFNGLKNQIGLFSNPKMVLIDSMYLKTLPKRELVSGLAEIIKYGLTYDTNLWNNIKQNTDLNTSFLSEIIYRSIEIKNEVVLKDPNEQNLRKILNYGHTIGHAIETYFIQSDIKKTLTHGESIAVGMVCETYLSSILFNYSKEELQTLKNYTHKVFGKIDLNTTDFNTIIDLMKHDKKNIKGQVRFVLLNDFASCKIDCKVDANLIIDSLNFYLS